MIRLLQFLACSLRLGVDSVGARSQALLSDLTTRVDKAVVPQAAGPTAEHKADPGIQNDGVQLLAEAKRLPAAAQQPLADLKASLERLQAKMQAGTPIKADDPDLLAFHKAGQQLQQVLAAASKPPTVNQQEVAAKAEAVRRCLDAGDGAGAMRIISDLKPAAAVGALLDRLKDKVSYEDLLKKIPDKDKGAFVAITAAGMSPQQKAAAIKELQHGLFSPNAMEQSVMLLLMRDSSLKPGGTAALMAELSKQGLSFSDLYGDMSSGPNQASCVQFAAGMAPEQKAQAIKDLDHGLFSPTAAEKRAIMGLVGSTKGPENQQVLLKSLAARGMSLQDLQADLPKPDGRQQLDQHLQGLRELESKHVPLTPDGYKKALLARIPGDDDKAKAARAELEKELDDLARQGKLNGELTLQLLKLTDEATPLAKGVDRQALFIQAVKDLANPTAIGQGQWGTCAATCVQIALALREPARYVQVLTALASPSGDANSLVPGLKRPADQKLDEPDKPPPREGHKVVAETSDRSITTRIMSAALMNKAYFGEYKDAIDKTDDGDSGLSAFQENLLFKRVLDLESKAVQVPPASQEELNRQVDAAAEQGPVSVGMRWGDGGHQVLYLGSAIDPDSGKEVALLINPWGHRHTMPMDEFRARIDSAMIPLPDQPSIPRPENWQDLKGYTPLNESQYLSPDQMLIRSPGFTKLDVDMQKDLKQLVNGNKLGEYFVESTLRPLIAEGKLTAADVKRLLLVAKGDATIDQKESAVRDQIMNLRTLNEVEAFRKLSPEQREATLDLLARHKLGSSSGMQVATLARLGKLTPELLTQLQAKPDAKAVEAAIEQAARAAENAEVLDKSPALKRMGPAMRAKVMEFLDANKLGTDSAQGLVLLAEAGKLTPQQLKEFADKGKHDAGAMVLGDPVADAIQETVTRKVPAAAQFKYYLNESEAFHKLSAPDRQRVLDALAHKKVDFSQGIVFGILAKIADGKINADFLKHASDDDIVKEAKPPGIEEGIETKPADGRLKNLEDFLKPAKK